jgi:hypothetical protein
MNKLLTVFWIVNPSCGRRLSVLPPKTATRELSPPSTLNRASIGLAASGELIIFSVLY